MTDPSICPATRKRCSTVEVCWLIHCSKDRSRRERPIHERELTQAEKYALAMEDKKRERKLATESAQSESIPAEGAEDVKT